MIEQDESGDPIHVSENHPEVIAIVASAVDKLSKDLPVATNEMMVEALKLKVKALDEAKAAERKQKRSLISFVCHKYLVSQVRCFNLIGTFVYNILFELCCTLQYVCMHIRTYVHSVLSACTRSCVFTAVFQIWWLDS